MKKYLILLLSVVGLSFFMSGCAEAKLSPEVHKAFEKHATVYTQRNMHYNISRNNKIVEGTNYQVGILIPVNSKVILESVNAKQIVFTYQGNKIILRNIPKYTGIDIAALYARYFAPKKVNLSKFTSMERDAIKVAQVRNGMSKEAVLVSLGFPPAHATPSLKMDQWKYWKNRWITFLVNFKNGKVIN